MNGDDFRQCCATSSDEELVRLCLHDDGLPFLFEPNPKRWELFRKELSTSLRVANEDIRIVGSGRLGISMKPNNNLKPFSDKSDIDVLVVNETVFDELWTGLLRAVYPRNPIKGKLGGWLQARQRELYTGWLSPLEIKLDKTIFGSRVLPILSISNRWFNTLKRAARHAPRRHEDITGRLYRTWEHAELYHRHSLTVLKRSIEQ